MSTRSKKRKGADCNDTAIHENATCQCNCRQSFLDEKIIQLALELVSCKKDVALLQDINKAEKFENEIIRSKTKSHCIPGSIQLNIGGSVFTTRLSTLCYIPGSFLESMFSGRHDGLANIEGTSFIDRSPKYFEFILQWLRDPGLFYTRCTFL